jgi:transposase
VHRGEQTQLLRGRLRVRSTLIKARTSSINTVRGLLRSFGYRLPRAEAEYFIARLQGLDLPPEVAAMVRPLLTLVTELSRQIKALDKEVHQACRQFPAAARLQGIPGVGPVVSLAYLLCLEEPHRFKRSRDTAS